MNTTLDASTAAHEPQAVEYFQQRAWEASGISKIAADFSRSADTQLISMQIPGFPGIDLYFKDESSHPTGSPKHRLARFLFLYASATLGRRVGGSTGTNFVGVLPAAQQMRKSGRSGSIVTILCDSGERYARSYYEPDWYRRHGIDVAQADRLLTGALAGEDIPATVLAAGALW